MLVSPEDEADVVRQSVICGLHVLMDIAGDEDQDPSERIAAVVQIMAYALEAYPADDADTEDIEEVADSGEISTEVDRFERKVSLRQRFGLWLSSGAS